MMNPVNIDTADPEPGGEDGSTASETQQLTYHQNGASETQQLTHHQNGLSVRSSTSEGDKHFVDMDVANIMNPVNIDTADPVPGGEDGTASGTQQLTHNQNELSACSSTSEGDKIFVDIFTFVYTTSEEEVSALRLSPSDTLNMPKIPKIDAGMGKLDWSTDTMKLILSTGKTEGSDTDIESKKMIFRFDKNVRNFYRNFIEFPLASLDDVRDELPLSRREFDIILYSIVNSGSTNSTSLIPYRKTLRSITSSIRRLRITADPKYKDYMQSVIRYVQKIDNLETALDSVTSSLP